MGIQSEHYCEQAKRDLEMLLKENSPKVFCLSKFHVIALYCIGFVELFLAQDNLEKMKQDALIFCWMHENDVDDNVPDEPTAL